MWIALPPLGRVAGVFLFALLLIASLSPLVWLRLPRRAEALARLDTTSGIDHRPATALADRLAPAANDPVMEALWRAHRAHEAERAKNLRAGLPRPRLAWRDPYAIRALVLLAAVASFFLADGEQARRIAAAFDWSGAIYPRLYRVDAWVTPPAYTGRAPILLPGIRHDEPAPGETAAVLVPGGQRTRRAGDRFIEHRPRPFRRSRRADEGYARAHRRKAASSGAFSSPTAAR